jgi:hypothetical protein
MVVQGEQGKQFLCENASRVMEFYNSQLSSENYQVREAACHALSELFLRVAPSFNSDAFKPYVK